MSDSANDLTHRILRSDIDGPISRRETVLLVAQIVKYTNMIAMAQNLSLIGEADQALAKLKEAADFTDKIQESLFVASYGSEEAL
jgi:hypothetical protein